MKIESILKRNGGTTLELGWSRYHFEPLEDGAHVAEVEDTAHIDRLLSIPEGYKVYHGSLTPKGVSAKAEPKAKTVSAPEPSVKKAPLAGSEVHPPEFDIGGKVFTQLEIVQKAFEASGLTSDEWNDLDIDDRAAKIDITLDNLLEEADEDQSEDSPANSTDRDALVAQYEAKFGKKPHYRLSTDKIKAELGL